MRTETPGSCFVPCNLLVSATIQWSSPICEARVTAGSQGPELRSRDRERRALTRGRRAVRHSDS